MLRGLAMLQDLRFSIRSLLGAPGFAVAAVLTLGVGIGATTMAYGIVDGLLLRPLPFGDSFDPSHTDVARAD